ncbi:flagellin [Clostridium ganghwense]|uniref:Flagellin n=1 Tax=Clostridium ganghwense TaxID=312089 RepID=A0ABT4CMW9_9CLOT|nr:flagellin [Clostridium ganghwense]MCY6370402.1 flagellin [Clostridium ganghwense]
MIINHNMNAINAHRNMMGNIAKSGKSMEKLSSGLRINRAGDDAAGLAISEKMRGQIRGLDQATRNSQDGISMIQTAEGALNETHSILQRMKELSTQAANDTNTSEDRGQIQKEMNQLTSEINRIGNTTEFNTQKLLNGGDKIAAAAAEFTLAGETIAASGSRVIGGLVTKLNANATLSAKYTIAASGADLKITEKTAGKTTAPTVAGGALTVKTEAADAVKKGDVIPGGTDGGTFSATLQIGANKGQAFKIDVLDMRAKNLGITTTGTEEKLGVTNGTTSEIKEQALDVSSHEKATGAIETLDKAINKVSTERSKLGAYQNRLEHTINNLGTASENLTAAESRVRDVDMAKEMMSFSKKNILSQAAQAMLSQANQQPQGVLQLLR